MKRSSARNASDRIALAFARATIEAVNDSPLMQELKVRLLHGELADKLEHFQHYGFSSVAKPPDGKKKAEAIVAFINGNRSHPAVVANDDRRSRPKNYKPGESAHYDDMGQYSKLARDGHHRVAKQHTITAAGDEIRPGGVTQPDTTFELNEQLKGLSARMAQAEHNLHGLFDVTSKFRQIVQDQIPAVSAVAGILNQDPSGLKPMADAIIGKEQDYLQKQVEQALQKFLSPNLAGLQSLLGGGLESSISSLISQVSGLAASNPVVGQVDDMVQQIADLASSGAEPAIISQATAALQAQITALTSANPIVGQIAGLRNTLQGLLAAAGPALNFLAPQQRLVQGISKSMRFSNPG